MNARPHLPSLPCHARLRATMFSGAFSLIELLIVIGIMAIMLGLSVPAVVSVMEGNNIARGAQTVIDQIRLARQWAASHNNNVEIRMIKSDPMSSGYSALQLWMSQTASGITTTNPVAKPSLLPQAIIISTNSALSPILTTLPNGITPSTMLSGAYSGATYSSFQISPTGLILPTMPNMPSLALTVLSSRYWANSTLPKNYAMIQINPNTGSPLIFRP